jgi:hypothetical protein
MKRLFVVFSLVVLMLMGCVTNKGMFDENIPSEQQCTLEIPYSLTVIKFDDTKVSWNVGFFGRAYGLGKAIVMIPTGEHTLTLNYWTQSVSQYSSRSWSADGLIVSYNFLPGCIYKIVPNISGNIISLRIDDITKP